MRDTPDFMLRPKEVSRRTGLSETSIWRMRKAGSFPVPAKLGSDRMLGWPASEIDAWIAARLAERPAA